MKIAKCGGPSALCRECIKREGRPTPAEECDHIINKASADADGMVKLGSGDRVHFNDVRNLQPLCKQCHADKTKQDKRSDSPRLQRSDGW